MARENRWSGLQYELSYSGGTITKKYWKRWSHKAGMFVSLLMLMSLFCLAGSYVLWCTSTVNNIVQSMLTYREGGMFLNEWQHPKYTPIIKFYVYNYTNTEEFLTGKAKKLRVEEVGPYTFMETVEKINVTFHGDDTLSFSENRVVTFLPDESIGSEDDIMVVPNIPLIFAVSIVRDRGLAAQFGLRSALWALNLQEGPFDRVTAKEYAYGYSTDLYDVAQNALKMTGSHLPKLGILATRTGISSNVYTINTGAKNYSAIDLVTKIDGKSDLGVWGDPECDRVDGAVGAVYPGPLTRERLHLFHADLCRRIDIDFQKELMVMGDLPAYRYTPPPDFFQNGTVNPKNACFSRSSYANWPSGAFYQGPCASDLPVFASYPRFYQGDPSLRRMVDGIPEPEMEKHQFYMDLHPEMGIAMGVGVRFQVNFMIRKAPLVGSYLDAFEDNIILPAMWFESIISGYDSSGYRQTWHCTYTLRWAEAGFKYTLPLLAALLAFLAGRSLWKCAQCQGDHRDRMDQLRAATGSRLADANKQQLQPLTSPD